MQVKVFNTPFENMLRVLLLLDCSVAPLSADRIVYIDFICLYGKDYNLLDRNLNGDNHFGLAEFTNKRLMVKEAISRAVRNSYIDVCITSKGLIYKINDRGKTVLEGIRALRFSNRYSKGVSFLLSNFKTTNSSELLSLIQSRTSELEVD